MSSIKSLLLLALAATPSLAQRTCGSSKPHKQLVNLHAHHAQKSALARLSSKSNIINTRQPFGEDIDTYIHVIGPDDPSSSKWIDAENFAKQIDVLNEAYSNTGFTFRYKDFDRNSNSSWELIPDDSDVEYDMKAALRKGSKYSDLNLYFSLPSDGENDLLGFAKFPVNNPTADQFLLDGVVLDAKSVPGGPTSKFNLGITAVHEVGHWLGLLHTFSEPDTPSDDGGCAGPGDHIFDTPAERSNAFGCQIGRDTCRGALAYGGIDEAGIPTSEDGPDPVHNYMDYSDDACLTQFTDGQIERMQELWTLRSAPPAPIGNGTTTGNVTIGGGDRRRGPHRVARLF